MRKQTVTTVTKSQATIAYTALVGIFVDVMGLFLLGFASLIGNSLWPQSSEMRRKTRVILWGTPVGFGPGFVVLFTRELNGKQFTDAPFWVWSLQPSYWR
ncbi:MAG: hypothetical protein JO108_13460 [Acidobacteriaceae bacterium]|nr:hypothetical protein [Acidobacteriaceae bacterium]